MALPAAALPWAKLAKYGLRAAGEAWAIYEAYLAGEHVKDPVVGEWRQLQWHFTRSTPAGRSEDRAIMTFDFFNVTDNDWDSTWTTADYTAVETPALTCWNALKGVVQSNHTLVEMRWFRRSFREVMTPSVRFNPSGPPERITPVGTSGSLSTTGGNAIYQAACSITEVGPLPGHWGRTYLPGVSATNVDASSRFITTCCDAVATAVQTWYSAAWTAQLIPCIATTQLNKNLGGFITPVLEIHVDDVPDVIRRRRPKQTTYRAIKPVT